MSNHTPSRASTAFSPFSPNVTYKSTGAVHSRQKHHKVYPELLGSGTYVAELTMMHNLSQFIAQPYYGAEYLSMAFRLVEYTTGDFRDDTTDTIHEGESPMAGNVSTANTFDISSSNKIISSRKIYASELFAISGMHNIRFTLRETFTILDDTVGAPYMEELFNNITLNSFTTSWQITRIA